MADDLNALPSAEERLAKIRDVATTKEAGDLLRLLTDNAQEWAAAFCAVAKTLGHDLDEDWMMVWFANAIEHSSQHRELARLRQPAPEDVMDAAAQAAITAAVQRAWRKERERCIQAIKLMDTRLNLKYDQAFWWEDSRDTAVLAIRALSDAGEDPDGR